MYGSTPTLADDHEIPFPTSGAVWISDSYVCVVPVPADEWPPWTDAVAFGEGPGHAGA